MRMKHTGLHKPPGERIDGNDLPDQGHETGRNPNDYATSSQFAEGFDNTEAGLNIPPKTISYGPGDHSYPNYHRIDTERDDATGERTETDRYRGGFLTRFDEDDTGREDIDG